jgi:hypothetical protein
MPKTTKAPTGVTITSYQVGFGDCFLLSFHYGAADRHVLMDFGTKMTSQVGFKVDMVANAQQIAKDCGGKLTIVVATHRHYDHISGFETDKKTGKGPGDIIRALKPDLVVQPWTEDPKIPGDATAPAADKSHVKSLANMQALANAVAFNLGSVLRARGSSSEELDYLGGDNITNRSAVENLMTMGRLQPKYLCLGSLLDVASLLPGVNIHVLGPPTIKQANALGQNLLRYAASSEEYWKLQARAATGLVPAAGEAGLKGRRKPLPPQTRWFAQRLRNVREDALLQIVRTLDQTINNTSLILLIEVGGKKLLFPGDAQLENWMCALADPKIVALLADVNVYKVGHHGSTNATPVSLWKGFDKRKGKALRTLLSTHEGEYSGVPRQSLHDALQGESHLLSTADFETGQRSDHIDI